MMASGSPAMPTAALSPLSPLSSLMMAASGEEDHGHDLSDLPLELSRGVLNFAKAAHEGPFTPTSSPTSARRGSITSGHLPVLHLALTNPSDDCSVFFKFKTNAPARLRVRPAAGCVAPRALVDVYVQCTDAAQLRDGRDNVLLQMARADAMPQTEWDAPAAAVSRGFKALAAHDVAEFVLPCRRASAPARAPGDAPTPCSAAAAALPLLSAASVAASPAPSVSTPVTPPASPPHGPLASFAAGAGSDSESDIVSVVGCPSPLFAPSHIFTSAAASGGAGGSVPSSPIRRRRESSASADFDAAIARGLLRIPGGTGVRHRRLSETSASGGASGTSSLASTPLMAPRSPRSALRATATATTYSAPQQRVALTPLVVAAQYVGSGLHFVLWTILGQLLTVLVATLIVAAVLASRALHFIAHVASVAAQIMAATARRYGTQLRRQWKAQDARRSARHAGAFDMGSDVHSCCTSDEASEAETMAAAMETIMSAAPRTPRTPLQSSRVESDAETDEKLYIPARYRLGAAA